jgi:photosystem II stability/assembly factor-like uncharacterized protein
VKKLTFCLTLVGLLLFALGGTAGAQPSTLNGLATAVVGTGSGTFGSDWAALADPLNPTVSAIVPASARDDSDTPVTITGTDFADTPTVTLGDTALTDVTWVNSTTLTATVPSGIDPGVYTLTVVNPDSGFGTLTGAFAVTPLIPAASAVGPLSAANDIDTSVTITGTDFAAAATVSLGSTPLTPLTNVTWVDSTTLTATVPWGIDPGTYDLTVVNPDGSDTMAEAFTVTQGIGRWNTGDLYGGEISQLFLRPGDSNTVYAAAFGVIGLFRSDDAGENWAFVSNKAWANNNKFAVDQLHPNDVYAFAPNGLMRSQDKGDTWTSLKDNKWPDGRDMHFPQVYVSPYLNPADPKPYLFVSSSSNYGTDDTGGAFGLIRSTDDGATWAIVTDLEGQKVQDIAFDPDPARRGDMVLVTSDMKVYKSTDWGDTWTKVDTSGLTPTLLGLGGSITFDPSGSEVWIDCFAQGSGGGIFKCPATDIYDALPTDVTIWQDVSQQPGSGSYSLAFASDTSVYIARAHSDNDGEPYGGGASSWEWFGPSPWYGYGALLLDPNDPQTVYIADDALGLEKTTDGGAHWDTKANGLTALSCTSMDVSKVDPLRVYATFAGPQGIYRSDDGTSHWTFLPIDGSWNVRQVLVDPFDPQYVYMAGDPGFYESTNGGDTWTAKGWSGVPNDPQPGLFVTMAADPHQAGHLLASFGGGSYGVGPGYLYKSDNYGDSWQEVTGLGGSGVHWIRSVVYDPAVPGKAYLTTSGGGVYTSTDGGASWARIADQPPDVAAADSICIATGPQPVLIAGVSPYPYRSLDGGQTWQIAGRLPSGGTDLMFANNDSTRLYFASPQGLFLSSDVGDTWERAAGAFGQLQTTALGYANSDGHTILYAATSGGDAGAVGGASARSGRKALAASSALVSAGIYRYAQVAGRATICALAKKSATIGYGAKTTVSGTLTDSAMGVRGCGVVLQSSSDGKTFTNTGSPHTTGAGGAFKFTVAPTTKTYYRVSFAGSGNYYVASASATICLTPRVYLSTPTAPATAYRSRTFTSVTYLKPLHRAATYPAKLQCYRNEKQRSGTYKWVLRKTVAAKAVDYSTYTKVTAKVSLPYAGKWRIRAYHAADSKNAATYSGYRYLSVR